MYIIPYPARFTRD